MLLKGLQRTGALFEQCPYLHRQGVTFLLWMYALVIGFSQMAAPAPVIKKVFQKNPALRVMQIKFSASYADALAAILDGWKAQNAAQDAPGPSRRKGEIMKQDIAGAGRWALVTGATHGIGYELCRRFADDGFGVVLVARSADRLSEVAQEIEKASPCPDPRASGGPVRCGGGRGGVLLCARAGYLGRCAGQQRWIRQPGPFRRGGMGDTAPDDAGQYGDPRRLTRLFLPEMLRRGSGRILNVGSTGSFAPVPYMAVYGATKAFVLSFSEALSAELEGTGVTVTALCPGVTATQFARRAGTENTRLARMNKMAAGDVARAGYQAMMNSKPRVVPGLFNKLLIGSLRFHTATPF